MSTTTLILIVALLVALLAFAYVAIGAKRLEAKRNARVAAEQAATPAPAPAAGPPPAAPATAPAGAAAPESPFLSAPDGPADDLMAIKGIGPKLAARLSELGVFHYRQIAGWTPAQLAQVDALLGQFQGRPERDQWQSQAALLAAGDIKAYERAHGKLGPAGGPAA
jgi:predicted flap endonuclease-1-like 5' DNA nuclease